MNNRYTHLLVPGDRVGWYRSFKEFGRGKVVRRQPNRRVVIRDEATGRLMSFREIQVTYLPYLEEIERKKELLLRSRRDLKLRQSLGLDTYQDPRWREQERIA